MDALDEFVDGRGLRGREFLPEHLREDLAEAVGTVVDIGYSLFALGPRTVELSLVVRDDVAAHLARQFSRWLGQVFGGVGQFALAEIGLVGGARHAACLRRAHLAAGSVEQHLEIIMGMHAGEEGATHHVTYMDVALEVVARDDHAGTVLQSSGIDILHLLGVYLGNQERVEPALDGLVAGVAADIPEALFHRTDIAALAKHVVGTLALDVALGLTHHLVGILLCIFEQGVELRGVGHVDGHVDALAQRTEEAVEVPHDEVVGELASGLLADGLAPAVLGVVIDEVERLDIGVCRKHLGDIGQIAFHIGLCLAGEREGECQEEGGESFH